VTRGGRIVTLASTSDPERREPRARCEASADANENPMKLNFWQWLGILLVVVGLIWFIYSKRERTTPQPAPADLPAATAPTP